MYLITTDQSNITYIPQIFSFSIFVPSFYDIWSETKIALLDHFSTLNDFSKDKHRHIIWRPLQTIYFHILRASTYLFFSIFIKI